MRFAQAFLIRSLRDLFGGRTTWFDSALEFILRFGTIEVGNQSDQCPSKLLRRLYVEVTQILRRTQPEGVLVCPEQHSAPPPPYYFGIQLSCKKFFFPIIPRNQLFRVVGKALPPDKPHPMLFHMCERDRSRASYWVQDFYKLFKRLRRRLLPIYSDVRFRLSFCILPVRALSWFLQQAHPEIILCTQKHCGEVESYQHLFFDCSWTIPIWEEIFLSWSVFFSVRPLWSHISCARLPNLCGPWKPFRMVLEDLWFAFIAVTLHYIWTDRNRRLFDQSTSTPTAPAVSVIYCKFSAHIRFFQRPCYDPEQLEQLEKILKSLSTFSSARRYFSARPSLLQIRRR
uniref:AlNc14C81G5296 protein n=1 Tax=Albugo laibachii Nc14 TaxID=890382 RepID=F0WFA4_9STRA|nr:AlNc14C81G5296 [Albugo laibachii Nc14]|eukprot:CCA19886.1 AlNc14C81G5296 [Albugo laibachii Nc14]